MKPKIRVIPLGGAAEIGANSYYISWEKNDGRIFSLLLDAGMRGDGPSVENLPDFSKLDTKVDAVIISHAHNDHIGSLPFVLKNFLKDDGKIYMTSKTSIIAAKTLKDSAKIVSGKGKFSSVIKKLYSNQNMDDIIDRTIKVDYNNEIKLNDDIRMVFYDAGHVYGSSSILLKDENFSLFYTGDFNCAETFIHNGVRIPDNLTADIMITETTNYSKSEANLKNQEKI
ncbi:MAG: MBL fold metallo-hydrolase [Elusimicrobia bacterium]|nr:MBL fold metallo-hydrolase [Elusimicrobiota bacterium]